MEYVELAQQEGGLQPGGRLEMMQLAKRARPEDLMIKFQTAEVALSAGRVREAARLVEELIREEWRTLYYPRMKDYLKEFSVEIERQNSEKG